MDPCVTLPGKEIVRVGEGQEWTQRWGVVLNTYHLFLQIHSLSFLSCSQFWVTLISSLIEFISSWVSPCDCAAHLNTFDHLCNACVLDTDLVPGTVLGLTLDLDSRNIQQ